MFNNLCFNHILQVSDIQHEVDVYIPMEEPNFNIGIEFESTYGKMTLTFS